MGKKTLFLIILGVVLAITLPLAWQNVASLFQKKENRYRTGNVKVVATIFPIFDLAKNIGGRNAEVQLLVPTGMDIHTYEPSAEDIIKMENADIIIYAGKGSDAIAKKAVDGLQNKTAVIISASQGGAVVPTIPGLNEDSHYWLYPNNISYVIKNILAAYSQKDPNNKDYYAKNAQILADEYAQVTARYDSLKICKTKAIKYSGHNAFSYLAAAYKLDFIKSSQKVSLSDAESLSNEDKNTQASLAEILNRNLVNLKEQLNCQ